MKKIRTVHDARREKWAMDAAQDAKWAAMDAKWAAMDAADAKRAADRAIIFANPSIGMIVRDGEPMYYRFAPEYRESRNPADLIDKEKTP